MWRFKQWITDQQSLSCVRNFLMFLKPRNFPRLTGNSKKDEKNVSLLKTKIFQKVRLNKLNCLQYHFHLLHEHLYNVNKNNDVLHHWSISIKHAEGAELTNPFIFERVVHLKLFYKSAIIVLIQKELINVLWQHTIMLTGVLAAQVEMNTLILMCYIFIEKGS